MARLTRAERAYDLLLRVYPSSYRHRFQTELRQTFRDLYRDHTEADESSARFWTTILLDTAGAAAGQHYDLIRSPHAMKNYFANSAGTKSLFWGIGLMIPAALMLMLAVLSTSTGSDLPALTGAPRIIAQLLFVSAILLPLVALAINIAALIKSNRRLHIRGLGFFKRYFWTLALVAAAILWVIFLYGHDTVGCAGQYLTQLDWSGFTACNADH